MRNIGRCSEKQITVMKTFKNYIVFDDCYHQNDDLYKAEVLKVCNVN